MLAVGLTTAHKTSGGLCGLGLPLISVSKLIDEEDVSLKKMLKFNLRISSAVNCKVGRIN